MLIYVICVHSFSLQYHFPLRKYAIIRLLFLVFMDSELFPVLVFAKSGYREGLFNVSVRN